MKAVELDDRLGGLPIQVRVVEGKEPNHFLAMFQGKLKVFQGGLSSSFEGKFLRILLLTSREITNNFMALQSINH